MRVRAARVLGVISSILTSNMRVEGTIQQKGKQQIFQKNNKQCIGDKVV